MIRQLIVLSVFFFVSLFSLPAQKLYDVVEKGDTAQARLLLQKGAKVNKYNKKGLFPLWRAAADNNYAMAKLLISFGADVRQRSKVSPGNPSSLEIPCQNGHLSIVQLLVENGADVNEKGFRDFTPIRIAARNGHLDIVQYLAEKGARIDALAMDGATSLEHAAGQGHLDIVKYLLDKGAKVNHQDNDGDTPLGEAARKGYTEVMQHLLDKGADPRLKNKKGYDALELARIAGQKNAVLLLEKQLKN